jgi:hypothetical protein
VEGKGKERKRKEGRKGRKEGRKGTGRGAVGLVRSKCDVMRRSVVVSVKSGCEEWRGEDKKSYWMEKYESCSRYFALLVTSILVL